MGDGVVVVEGRHEMVSMFLADLLDSKIVDDKGELDGAPLVLPKSRDDFDLEVSVFAKAFF